MTDMSAKSEHELIGKSLPACHAVTLSPTVESHPPSAPHQTPLANATYQPVPTQMRPWANAASPFGAAFYEAAVAQAAVGVLTLDCTGMVRAANQRAGTFWGFHDTHDMIGQPLLGLVVTEQRVELDQVFRRSVSQRSINSIEVAIVPPGGQRWFYLGLMFSPVLDGAGELQGVMAWVRDISNRKELESNLSRTRMMASLGTLASGVAHHFNNIICGASTMVDFALDTDDPATMKRALRMVNEATSRISYITQSLLAMSGPSDSAPDMADMTEEILRFADAVEPTLTQHSIKLELDLQSTCMVEVPRQRFSQALAHLLQNAEDAFAGISPLHNRVITVRTHSQAGQVLMQFQDTGAGIKPEHVPQVFDPFFTTKGVQSGGNGNNPGLGLTIIHSLVMDLGGHVWLESVLGEGTTVNIMLPGLTYITPPNA